AARPNPAVGLLAGENGVDPPAGVADNGFVFQDITEIAIAFQPIRQLFPSAMAFAPGTRPGIAFVPAPFRNLFEVAGHTIRFQFELVPQPASGSDRADGKFAER